MPAGRGAIAVRPSAYPLNRDPAGMSTPRTRPSIAARGVSSACIASGAAATTALRWLARLEAEGLVVRRRDTGDGRRTFLDITDEAADAVRRWLITTFGD